MDLLFAEAGLVAKSTYARKLVQFLNEKTADRTVTVMSKGTSLRRYAANNCDSKVGGTRCVTGVCMDGIVTA